MIGNAVKVMRILTGEIGLRMPCQATGRTPLRGRAWQDRRAARAKSTTPERGDCSEGGGKALEGLGTIVKATKSLDDFHLVFL